MAALMRRPHGFGNTQAAIIHGSCQLGGLCLWTPLLHCCKQAQGRAGLCCAVRTVSGIPRLRRQVEPNEPMQDDAGLSVSFVCGGLLKHAPVYTSTAM
jgi:hypothetical protein